MRRVNCSSTDRQLPSLLFTSKWVFQRDHLSFFPRNRCRPSAGNKRLRQVSLVESFRENLLSIVMLSFQIEQFHRFALILRFRCFSQMRFQQLTREIDDHEPRPRVPDLEGSSSTCLGYPHVACPHQDTSSGSHHRSMDVRPCPPPRSQLIFYLDIPMECVSIETSSDVWDLIYLRFPEVLQEMVDPYRSNLRRIWWRLGRHCREYYSKTCDFCPWTMEQPSWNEKVLDPVASDKPNKLEGHRWWSREELFWLLTIEGTDRSGRGCFPTNTDTVLISRVSSN